MVGGVLWFSLIFACIGLCWTLPIGIGFVQLGLGLWMTTGRRSHNVPIWIGFGALASLMNFNPLSFIMDILALHRVRTASTREWLELDTHEGNREW